MNAELSIALGIPYTYLQTAYPLYDQRTYLSTTCTSPHIAFRMYPRFSLGVSMVLVEWTFMKPLQGWY